MVEETNAPDSGLHRQPNHATGAQSHAVTDAAVDEKVIVAALAELHAQAWFTQPPALPPCDAEFLDAHGGARHNLDALVAARVASRVQSTALERDAMTLATAAEYLGTTPDAVRRQIDDGNVYSYPASGTEPQPWIPRWQFTADPRTGEPRPTPHLGSVLAELPETCSWAEIRDFAFHAEVEHATADLAAPLLDWLRSGRDPAPARALAAELDRFI